MGSFLSWGQDGRWEHAFSMPGSKEESGDGGGDREQISKPGGESASEKKLAKKKKIALISHLPHPTPGIGEASSFHPKQKGSSEQAQHGSGQDRL